MHLLPFLRAQAVLRRHISAFLAGKSNVAARLTRKYWVPHFRHFITIPPPPSTLIYHYLSLFVTIRDYSLFGIRDYSLFGFSRHPTIHWITQLVLLVFIRWIGIYLGDSVIHLLKNRGQTILLLDGVSWGLKRFNVIYNC